MHGSSLYIVSVDGKTQEFYQMTIAVGDSLPDVKLVKATPDGPQQVQSSEYFKGKTVALFSVPGAFTPTCSAAPRSTTLSSWAHGRMPTKPAT